MLESGVGKEGMMSEMHGNGPRLEQIK
jgi:hypothetical protein